MQFRGNRTRSSVAQWKRAGPITQRSVDRNHSLLPPLFSCEQSHQTAYAYTNPQVMMRCREA
uniref:Transposase n=1 Tax=Ascaris lumbricoides TaxID=6252 RepID=A0A0M3IBV8_ASCLU